MENVMGRVPVRAVQRQVPGGFVPVIHIRHIRQIERHDAGV